MAIYIGNHLIAGVSHDIKYNAHTLFDFKWTDCLQNDMSWLRADTFSWQRGTVYKTAYEHLVNDIDGITPITESGMSVYIANDGHKIVLAEDEQTVLDLYNNTGVAWYYILNQDNTRFKLPRTQNHGELIETGESNGISYRIWNDGYCEQWGQTTQVTGGNTTTVSYLKTYNNDDVLPYIQPLGAYTGQGEANDVVISHSASGFTLQSGHIAPQYFGWKACGYLAQDQYIPTNTPNRYLYFYVGEFSQTAIEQTAGITAEQLNTKVDLNLNNMNPSATAKETIVGWGMPDYENVIEGTMPSLGSWVQCVKDSFVCCYGSDSYIEDYWCYVSPDNGTTTYVVGRRYDDVNANTQHTSFTFFVPKGWYFICTSEAGGPYYIYPLKGVN